MALKFIEQAPEESGSLNVDYTRDGKVTYLAYFDVADDLTYVRQNCGLTVGTRHPTDRQMVLLKLDYASRGVVTFEGDNTLARMWDVTANYGPWNPAERGDPSQAANPLLMPARYRLEWEKVPEPIWVDLNADDPKPILNAAGDPFDPPVERDTFLAILTVRRNEEHPDFPALIGLAGGVNKDPWLNFDPKTVRVAPIAIPELEYSQEAQKYYYPMVYVFEINPRTWKRRPLQAGYRQRTSAGKLTMILDDSGQPLQSPGLLDADGKHLKPPVAEDQVGYGEYDVHPDQDFGVFEMGNLFTPPPVLS